MLLKKYSFSKMIMCALFTALIAVGAFIRIPIPIIPFTLQTLFVIMAGLMLGSKGGALSALIYMFLGLAGLPIFTAGGGIMYVLKPTFGYIIGFVIGAYFAGYIMEKSQSMNFKTLLFTSFVGLFCIYLCGCLYLFLMKNIYLGVETTIWNVLFYGFLTTVPGDIILTIIGVVVVKRVKPQLNKMQK